MAETIVIAELDINVEALVKNTSEVKKAIDNLKKAQADLKKQGDTSSKQYIQNAADLKTLSSAYSQNIKALSENTKAVSDLAAREDLLNNVLQQEVTTIKEARNQNKLLNKLRNETNATTAEGQAQIKQLNNALDANNEFIKENADNYLQQKINIGNYKDSIKEAFDEINIFNGGIGGFISRSKEAGGAGKLFTSSLKGMTKGMIGMTKAAISFLLTPLGAVLGIIAGAFLLVKNAMNKSEDATNKISKAFSVFSGLLNLVLKVLKPLGDFLINGIVKSLEFVEAAVYSVIDAFAGILNFLGFEDAAKSVQGFSNEIKEASKQAKILAEAEAELEKAQRKARLTQLEFQKDAEKLRQIRDDETRSTKERIAANEELGAVLERQLAEELKIANLALKVANLRLEAEGETKEILDLQADALTEITDIQERITSQESEQLTNRVSLQKEAAEKSKAIRQKATDDAIKQLEDELNLFKAQQGVKAKTLEDEIAIEEQFSQQSIEIYKAKLKANKISQEEFDTEVLNLKNALLEKEIELITQNADRELEIFLGKNQQKIDSEQFFSDESLRIENERIAKVQAAQEENARVRFESGAINEQDYQNEITAIQNETRLAREEAQALRNEAEAEKKAVDLANQKEIDLENFETDFERQAVQLEAQRLQEVENAEQTGANVDLINTKYANRKEVLDEAAAKAKQDVNIAAFGQIAELLGEETTLGKAAALANIGINIQQGISKAIATGGFAGIVQGVVIAAQGAKSIAKVTGIDTKFEQGGFREVGGKRHSQGGTKFIGDDGTGLEVEKGEGIGVFSRDEFAALRNQNNASLAGVGSTSNVTQFVSQTSSLSANEIQNIVAATVQSMPQPVVAVEDIIYQSNSYVNVKTGADL